MPHSAQEARALLFNRKLQEKPVIFSIPGVEELDGELSMLELTGTELKQAEKLADTPDGADEIKMMAGVVAKSLIMRETKERLFSDNDIDTVAGFGLVALKPLSDLASETSGIGIDLLADAKKKLLEAQSSASVSSSTESLAVAAPGSHSMNSSSA